MHTPHTSPSDNPSPFPNKNIWDRWKKTIQTIVHNLTYNHTKQKERKRVKAQFVLNRFTVLESIEKTGAIPEGQKSFFDQHCDTFQTELQMALQMFLKTKYLALCEKCAKEYTQGSFILEKLPENDFQLLVW